MPTKLLIYLTLAVLLFVTLLLFVFYYFLKKNFILKTETILQQQKETISSQWEQLSNKQSQVLSNNTEEKLKNFRLHQSLVMDNTKLDFKNMMDPLKDALKNYKEQVQGLDLKRQGDVSTLKSLVENLMISQKELQKETFQLSNALKKPGVKGRWGEIQLKRIVELSGMSQHVDFQEQKQGEDSLSRPDMVVSMPNGKSIVIDSKAVLQSYLEAEQSQSDAERERLLSKHAASLKLRIQELSRKAYWDQFKDSPEFIVLFVPGEAFFSAALSKDPELVEYGFKQKIILATPTTLMALLKAVAYGWRHEKVSLNAKKITHQAEKILGSLKAWSEHYASTGNALEKAMMSYNKSVGSLERRVIPAIEKMNQMTDLVDSESEKQASVSSSIKFVGEKKRDLTKL